MILGPGVATGVPKAVAPVFCGIRHGVPAIPQTAAEVERENCVVRTPLMLAWFNTLNASQMNCKRTRSQAAHAPLVGRIFEEVDVADFVVAGEEELFAVAGDRWVVQCDAKRPVVGHRLRLASGPWHRIDIVVVANEVD